MGVCYRCRRVGRALDGRSESSQRELASRSWFGRMRRCDCSTFVLREEVGAATVL